MNRIRRLLKKHFSINISLLSIFIAINIAAIINVSFAADESAENNQPQKTNKYSRFFDEKAKLCDALVITCTDFRFTTATQEFINDRLGLKGNYDYISILGSIRNLIDSQTRDLVLNIFGVSSRLHHIKRVVIITHKDCGAYGGSASFGSEIAENETLCADLRKAKALLIEKYPTLEGNEIKVHFEKIH